MDLNKLSNQDTVLFERERAFTNKIIAASDEAANFQEPALGCLVLYNELASSANTKSGRRLGAHT